MADMAVNNSQASTAASTPAQTGAQSQAQEAVQQEQNIHEMAAQENQQKAQEAEQKAQENKQAEQKAQDNKEAQQALEQAKIEAEKAEQAKIEAEKKARQEKEAAEKARQEEAAEQAQQKEAQKAKEEIEEAKEKIELEIDDKDVDSILEKSVKLGSFFGNAIKSLLSSGEIDNEEDITVISEKIENIEEQIEEAKEEEVKRAIEEAIEAEITPKASTEDTAKATEDITEAVDVDKFAQATSEELEVKEQESKEKIQGLETQLSKEQEDLIASLPLSVQLNIKGMSENAKNIFVEYLSNPNQEFDVSGMSLQDVRDFLSVADNMKLQAGNAYGSINFKGDNKEVIESLISDAATLYNNGEGEISKSYLENCLLLLYKATDASENNLTSDDMIGIASKYLNNYDFSSLKTKYNDINIMRGNAQEAEKAAEKQNIDSYEAYKAFYESEFSKPEYSATKELYDEQVFSVIEADENGKEIMLDIVQNGSDAIDKHLDYLQDKPELAVALVRAISVTSRKEGGMGYNLGHYTSEDAVNKLNEIVANAYNDNIIDRGVAFATFDAIASRTNTAEIPNAAEKQQEIILTVTNDESMANVVSNLIGTTKTEESQSVKNFKPKYITKFDKSENTSVSTQPIKQKATDILKFQREIRNEQIRLEQIKAEKAKAKEAEEAEKAEEADAKKAQEAEEAQQAQEKGAAIQASGSQVEDLTVREQSYLEDINEDLKQLSPEAREAFADYMTNGELDLSKLGGKSLHEILDHVESAKRLNGSLNEYSYEYTDFETTTSAEEIAEDKVLEGITDFSEKDFHVVGEIAENELQLSDNARKIYESIKDGNCKDVDLSGLNGKEIADLICTISTCKYFYTEEWLNQFGGITFKGGMEAIDEAICKMTEEYKNNSDGMTKSTLDQALAGLYSIAGKVEGEGGLTTEHIEDVVSKEIEGYDFGVFENSCKITNQKEEEIVDRKQAEERADEFNSIDDALKAIIDQDQTKEDLKKLLDDMGEDAQNAFLEIIKFDSSSVDISNLSLEQCTMLITALDSWAEAIGGNPVFIDNKELIDCIIEKYSLAVKDGKMKTGEAGTVLSKFADFFKSEEGSANYIAKRANEISGSDALGNFVVGSSQQNEIDEIGKNTQEQITENQREEAEEKLQDLKDDMTQAGSNTTQDEVDTQQQKVYDLYDKQYANQKPINKEAGKNGTWVYTYKDGTKFTKDSNGKTIDVQPGNSSTTRPVNTTKTYDKYTVGNNGDNSGTNKLITILNTSTVVSNATRNSTTQYSSYSTRSSSISRIIATIRNAESAVKSSGSEGTSSEVQNLLNSLSSVLAGRANGDDKEGAGGSSAGAGAIAAASSKKTGILGNIDSFKNAAKNGNSEAKGAYAQNAEEVSKAAYDNSSRETNAISDSQSMEELAKRSQMLQGDLQSEQETRQGINNGSNEAVKQSSDNYKLASQQYRTITNSSNTDSGKIEKEVLSVDENIIQEIQNTEVLSEATRAVGDRIEQQVSYENSLKAGYNAYGAQINTLKEEKAHIDFLDDQNAKRGIEKSIAEAEAKQKELGEKQEEARRTEEELKEEKDVLRGLKSESEIAITKYSTTKQDAKNDLSETKSEIEQNAYEDMTKAKSNEQNIKEALTKQSDNKITDTERQLKETNNRMARLREDLPELAASRENSKGDSNDQGQQKPLFKIEKEDQKEVNEKSSYTETVSDIKSAQATAAGNFDTGNGLQSENDEFGGIEEVIAQNAWNQHSAMTSERNESERLGREIASSKAEIASSGTFLNSLASRLRNNGAKLGNILRETAELKSIDLSNVEQSKATEIKRKEKSLRAEKEEAIKEQETLKAKAQAEKEKVESEARERNNNTESQAESVNRYNEAGNQAMSEIEIQRKREEDKRRI